MSIRAEWQSLVQAGEIFRLDPLVGDPRRRTVLMSPEVNDIVHREMEEGPEANRRSRLVATLQNIVAGRRLVVCMEPYKARKAVIGRLDRIEESIFDVRSQELPKIRVFGQFVEKDVFFAITCRPRTVRIGWLDWLALGDSNSKEWERGKRVTRLVWKRYFPANDPVSGDNLHDYLSRASLERGRRGARRPNHS